jgi:hypothetical protein
MTCFPPSGRALPPRDGTREGVPPHRACGQARDRAPTFRFSGERPRPCESTAVRLIRPDVLLGHLGVQDRPQVSTAVVSTALAAGLCIRPEFGHLTSLAGFSTS